MLPGFSLPLATLFARFGPPAKKPKRKRRRNEVAACPHAIRRIGGSLTLYRPVFQLPASMFG